MPMGEYFVQKGSLTAIADAIRAKTNETALLSLDEMITAISGITAAKLFSGSITTTSSVQTTKGITVTHNLGTTPNFAILYIADSYFSYNPVGLYVCHDKTGALSAGAVNGADDYDDYGPYSWLVQLGNSSTANSSTVVFKTSSSSGAGAGRPTAYFYPAKYFYLIGVI